MDSTLAFKQKLEPYPEQASNSGQRNDEEELSIKIPSSVYPQIIGKRGETIRKIEEDTGTRISIPKQGQEGEVVIRRLKESGDVVEARRCIEAIAESARQNNPTHFLCFPLYESNLKKKVDKFKKRVLEECSKCQGIDASIFELPSKIHLTIGTLTLLSHKEVENAKNLLSECCPELVRECLEDNAVKIELKGVTCMKEDIPAEAHVLYAIVLPKDGSDRLQRLADAIVERFVSKGLMEKEFDHVTLHASLMRSKLRNTDQQTPAKESRTDVPARSEKKSPFDATKIIRLFKDFSFGEYHLDAIHLSEVEGCDTKGHYKCVTPVSLP